MRQIFVSNSPQKHAWRSQIGLLSDDGVGTHGTNGSNFQIQSEFGAEIHHAGIGEDLESVRATRNIMISSSSFSWRAAMLSDADRIFFPRLANWSPWSVYFPGMMPPVKRLFTALDQRLVAFPASRLALATEFAAFLRQLSPEYRIRYMSHWRWRLKKRLQPISFGLRNDRQEPH